MVLLALRLHTPSGTVGMVAATSAFFSERSYAQGARSSFKQHVMDFLLPCSSLRSNAHSPLSQVTHSHRYNTDQHDNYNKAVYIYIHDFISFRIFWLTLHTSLSKSLITPIAVTAAPAPAPWTINGRGLYRSV